MTKVLHPSIPDYIKALPPDANLTTEEVAKCLGYKNGASLWSAIVQGYQPELKSLVSYRLGFTKFQSGACIKHAYWRVRDIKRIVRQLTATTA